MTEPVEPPEVAAWKAVRAALSEGDKANALTEGLRNIAALGDGESVAVEWLYLDDDDPGVEPMMSDPGWGAASVGLGTVLGALALLVIIPWCVLVVVRLAGLTIQTARHRQTQAPQAREDSPNAIWQAAHRKSPPAERPLDPQD